MGQEEEGSRQIILADEEKEDAMKKVEIPNKVLNAAFLDVGMIGPGKPDISRTSEADWSLAVQCDVDDGTCAEMEKVFRGYKPRMSQDVSRNYRFELDVDGNSWSGRFRRLMLSSVVVLKSTIFREYASHLFLDGVMLTVCPVERFRNPLASLRARLDRLQRCLEHLGLLPWRSIWFAISKQLRRVPDGHGQARMLTWI